MPTCRFKRFPPPVCLSSRHPSNSLEVLPSPWTCCRRLHGTGSYPLLATPALPVLSAHALRSGISLHTHNAPTKHTTVLGTWDISGNEADYLLPEVSLQLRDEWQRDNYAIATLPIAGWNCSLIYYYDVCFTYLYLALHYTVNVCKEYSTSPVFLVISLALTYTQFSAPQYLLRYESLSISQATPTLIEVRGPASSTMTHHWQHLHLIQWLWWNQYCNHSPLLGGHPQNIILTIFLLLQNLSLKENQFGLKASGKKILTLDWKILSLKTIHFFGCLFVFYSLQDKEK